jgi:transglutaminase-like putative cysteine protease
MRWCGISGLPDAIVPDAVEHAVEDLPDECLVFLIGSRYCETDRMMNTAWQLFGGVPPGWGRVKSICDYVHEHVSFGYQYARPTKTAMRRACRARRRLPGFRASRRHLLPLHEYPGPLCDRLSRRHRRALRPGPVDFSAWFEAYLGGKWHTFDARHNKPRIGRIVIARGRDASDVAISNSFGMTTLARFKVRTDEL